MNWHTSNFISHTDGKQTCVCDCLAVWIILIDDILSQEWTSFMDHRHGHSQCLWKLGMQATLKTGLGDWDTSRRERGEAEAVKAIWVDRYISFWSLCGQYGYHYICCAIWIHNPALAGLSPGPQWPHIDVLRTVLVSMHCLVSSYSLTLVWTGIRYQQVASQIVTSNILMCLMSPVENNLLETIIFPHMSAYHAQHCTYENLDLWEEYRYAVYVRWLVDNELYKRIVSLSPQKQ